MNNNSKEGEILTCLDDDLLLRRGRFEDAEALTEFISEYVGPDVQDEQMRLWALDLMDGNLPGFGPENITVVEDKNNGAIVSTLNWIPQVWSYDGTEFKVGRIEAVATHPDYRLRGLFRLQLETVHRWGEQRGELVQGITGIPWFYRRFGYEMAMDHQGGRIFSVTHMPELNSVNFRDYKLRPATETDVPFLDRLYRKSQTRYQVSCVRDEVMWRYELFGRREGSPYKWKIMVIESESRHTIGYVMVKTDFADGFLTLGSYELETDGHWVSATPTVLRQLISIHMGLSNPKNSFHSIRLGLGSDHPAYQLTHSVMAGFERPYAWYIRIADVTKFVRNIRSVLELRIAKSLAAGYSGELKISFFQGGLRLVFDSGRIVDVQSWAPGTRDNRLAPKERDALFPGMLFHQVLFGFRSVEDLEGAFPDCIVSSEHSRLLINTLFPKRNSWMWGIE